MPATKELLQEGRYRINQEFTPNGSDTVYDAYDTVNNSNVVVKQIPAKQDNKVAFENQAKILTDMKHDSLLHVKDFFADVDSQYLVMEAVEGDDLQELLRRNKSPFNLQDVVSWADQLLDALNYLHTFRPPVIHKNIKPENIKLTSSGKIKLVAISSSDSSGARITTALGPDPNSEEALKYAPIETIWQGLDPASQMAITNGYDERSERILKEPADPRTDIYSLGATLYHLVTATEPVNALERSIEVLDGKPDPLKEATKLNPGVPNEISDVLLKAMELKRENRYDSAVIMRQILKTAVTRLHEMAADDAKEQHEAAEALRAAEQKRVEEEAEQKRIAAEAEQKRVVAEAEQKRVAAEAEQKRLSAERQAAEAAEKKRKEEEAVAKKAAEAKAAKEARETKEAEAKAAREAKEKEQVSAKAATAAAEVSAYSSAAATADLHISDVPFSSSYDDAEPKAGFPMMPLIAAGAGLLVLVVVAFFLLSGGNDAKVPTQSIGSSAPQNAPASSLETAPDPSQVSAPSPQESASTQPVATETQAQERAAAAAREKADKVKKPGPTPTAAKPSEGKKAVTVDDIINDN